MRASKPVPRKYTVCDNVHVFGFIGACEGDIQNFSMMQLSYKHSDKGTF